MAVCFFNGGGFLRQCHGRTEDWRLWFSLMVVVVFTVQLGSKEGAPG